MNMENLQQKAANIRDERNPNENTAQRVGEVLVEMVKNIDTLDYNFKEQLDIQTEKFIELKRNISDIQNVILTTKRRNVSVGGNDYNVQKTDDYNWSVQVKEISESAATYHICGIKIGTIAEITSPLHIYVSSQIAQEANFSTIGTTWSPEYKIKECSQKFENGFCVFSITPEEIAQYRARTNRAETASVYLLMGSPSAVVRSTYVGKSCKIYVTDTLHDKPNFEEGRYVDGKLDDKIRQVTEEIVSPIASDVDSLKKSLYITKRGNVSIGGGDYNIQKVDDYNWNVEVKEISSAAATYHLCGIKIGTIAEITSPLHIYVSSQIAQEANFSTIGTTWSPEYKIKECSQKFENGFCVFSITPEEIAQYRARTNRAETASVYLLMGSPSAVVRSTYVGKSCKIYVTDTLHDKPEFEKGGKIIDTIISKHENSIVKLLSQMDKVSPKKSVVCYGDSLTAGSDANFNSTTGTGPWVSVLKRLVGEDYEFYNRGVGGEDSATIAGRQGGVPFYITSEIELPADTTPVELPKDTNESGNVIGLGIASECNGHIVYSRKILTQGGNINPVMIDGVECKIIPTIQSYTATSYKIARVTASSTPRKLLKGSFIYTNDMKIAKNADVAIIFIGQNGGYNNAQTLVEQVRRMVTFTNCGSKYIVISSHGNGNSNIQSAFASAFGAHYINLQQYLPNHGIEDAIRFGLTTAESMTGKVWDDGTLKNANDVHLTSLGNAVLGYRIFEIGKRIGIF